jgi:hypothetical protein
MNRFLTMLGLTVLGLTVLVLIRMFLGQALASPALAMARFDAQGAVPEIDAGVARSGITLLVAGVLMLTKRRHRG